MFVAHRLFLTQLMSPMVGRPEGRGHLAAHPAASDSDFLIVLVDQASRNMGRRDPGRRLLPFVGNYCARKRIGATRQVVLLEINDRAGPAVTAGDDAELVGFGSRT